MKPTIQKTPLDKAIDEQFSDLQRHDPSSDEATNSMDRFIKLHKLRAEIQPPRVSPDTIILAATNLFGIILVLKHEQLNVITTKAMSLAQKVR